MSILQQNKLIYLSKLFITSHFPTIHHFLDRFPTFPIVKIETDFLLAETYITYLTTTYFSSKNVLLLQLTIEFLLESDRI
jgi:hypothetical protein